MPLRATSVAVVGARHKNADGSDRRAEIEQCLPGDPIILLPEPENAFDKRAIAVFSDRMGQIGYIRAERAPRLRALLGSTDVVAVFQRSSTFGAWIRIAFDGEAPTLTDAMLDDLDDAAEEKRALSDTGYYRDEIWPDD